MPHSDTDYLRNGPRLRRLLTAIENRDVYRFVSWFRKPCVVRGTPLLRRFPTA